MRYLRKFNESFDTLDITSDVKDILLDLEDSGFKVDYKSKRSGHLEIIITKRVEGFNGGILGYEFIWKQFKDVIFRLMEYYYSVVDPIDIKNTNIISTNHSMLIGDKISLAVREQSPFRMFANGSYSWGRNINWQEIGVGFTKESDFINATDKFLNLGDYTRFEKFRLLINLRKLTN